MEQQIQDLKYALRLSIKNPAFTLVAILTLALGIGATAAVFAAIDAVLLRRLPYKNAENLVEVWNTYYPAWPKIGLSGADFHDWRPQLHSLTDIAGYRFVTRQLNMTGAGDPARVDASYATSNLFPLLGIDPLVGRSFLADEDKLGSPASALISERFWRTHFGGDPSAVGRSIALDGTAFTIVGVLPRNIHLMPNADLWLSAGQLTADELTGRVRHLFGVVGRLVPGGSVAQAQAELGALADTARQKYPATNKNFGMLVEPLRDGDAVKLQRGLLIVFAVVSFVLLVACANFTNLLLVRNAARRKEIAVRTSIGASHGRVIRQLITESIVLSLASALAGLVVARAALAIISAFMPATLLSVKPDLGLSGAVLAFTFLVALAVGIFAAIPATKPLRGDILSVLKDEDRGVVRSGHRLQSVVVIAQVALAVMPLVAAGLLVRGFERLLTIDPGFRAERLLTLRVSQPATPGKVYREFTDEQRQAYLREKSAQFEATADKLRQLPGIKGIGGIDALPLNASANSAARFVIEGEVAADLEARSAQAFNASVDYFTTAGIPLLEGRYFTRDDWAMNRVIVNKRMATQFWPGRSPIGTRINLCPNQKSCWATIIGVVGDVRQFNLTGRTTYDVYFPAWDWTPYFIIRTTADPTSVVSAVRATIRQALPELPITRVATAEDLIGEAVSPLRFAAILLSTLAFLTLVLAAVGIYGVMSYIVRVRTQELGVRMALGARRQDVLRSVLSRGARIVTLGVIIGWIGAFVTIRSLATVLYEVETMDLATFGGVAAVLVLAGLFACCLPAYRASRIDPLVALRYE